MDSRSKIVVTVVMGGVFMLALLFFVFRPLLGSVKALNLDLSTKQAELNDLEQQIVEFKSAQTDLARATFKDDIYATIVDREDLSQVIVQLETAAEENNIDEAIQIADDEAEGANQGGATASNVFSSLNLSKEVEYRLDASGTFPGMVGFMQELENLPHFTEFSMITLSAEIESLPSSQGGPRNTGVINAIFDGVFLVKNNPNADANAQTK